MGGEYYSHVGADLPTPVEICRYNRSAKIGGRVGTHVPPVPPALNFKKPSPARDPLLLSQTVSIFKEMASKKVMSPIASAKLEFRTKTSDPKHQLFGKKILVIYTPYGEIYRVSIKARTITSYWTVQ